MRKLFSVLILSCICTSFTGTISSVASMDMETESSVAGISVALNNYFAGSLHPEEELANVLSSDSLLAQSSTAPVQKEVPQVTAVRSAYENVAISKVTGYVNVRQEANTTSKVVGKIYNNCAATILGTVNGEDGSWYHMKSGTVTGYIKAQYFITGIEAEAIAKQVGTVYATVADTANLRLRERPDLESATLAFLAEGAHYIVVEEKDNFAKVTVDTDLEGYVFKDYVKITVEFNQAVSLEEEAAKLAADAKVKKEAEEAIRYLEEVKMVEAKKTAETTAKPKKEDVQIVPSNGAASGKDETIAPNPAGMQEQTTAAFPPAGPVSPGGDVSGGKAPGGNTSGEVTSATRAALVAYARQFLGNPYVYGGSSLTDGADCSGFTQGVYAHFGIATGRTSRDQSARGREISIGAVQPGDLLFYASGSYINHVALYIGGGQVIHASNPTTGIIISPSNYRTPCKAVSFLN